MGFVHPSGGQPTAVDLAIDTPPPASPAVAAPLSASLLERIFAAAAKGRYEDALALSRRHDSFVPEVVNARGVCLLRTGRYQEAVNLFRLLTLQPGCTWMRKDRPLHYKTNFATALLLSGHPSGCQEILHELGQPGPPVAVKLREAITRWESTLGWLAWLDWKVAGIERASALVQLDFPPGEFGHETQSGMVTWQQAA